MILSDLGSRLGATLEGDGTIEIRGIASLSDAGPDQVSFLTDPRCASQLSTCSAGAVLVPADFVSDGNLRILRVKDVNASLDEVLLLFAPPRDAPEVGIHPSACVSPRAVIGRDITIGENVIVREGARLGDRCVVGPGCVIGTSASLGDDCRLEAHVVIKRRCRLGKRVIVHSHATIGADGFGYRTVEGRQVKVPQIGIVEIGDDVEIGANSCIDRAKCGKTVVGDGTKIDNLVQIGHNVQIGKHCIICAQCGIAGSTVLGDYVVLGGQVGLVGHLRIGDFVQAAAQAGIIKSVEARAKVAGYPAREFGRFSREQGSLKKLPELVRTLRRMDRSTPEPAGEGDRRENRR